MIRQTDHQLEPIDPETALEMYLRERKEEIRQSTYRAHRKRLRHFVEWCSARGLTNLNALRG